MILAVAVLPEACVEEIALVVLVCAPAVVPVTFTAKLHEAFAASPSADKLTLPDPATAVIDPAVTPPAVVRHVPANAFGVETTRPAGSVSVKLIFESGAVEFGFAIVNVRLVDVADAIDAAPNAAPSVGAASGFTVRVAVPAAPAAASFEVTVLLVSCAMTLEAPVT